MIITNNGNKIPYFVVEGLDGVGKTSIIQLVSVGLKDEGYSVVAIREPSRNINDHHLLGWLNEDKPRDPVATALVQFASRRAQFARLAEELDTAKNTIVLADRSYLSTIVYQYNNLPLDEAINIVRAMRKVADIPDFDGAFHINVDYDTAMQRIKARNNNDHLDVIDAKLYIAARDRYEKLCTVQIENNHRLRAANKIVGIIKHSIKK